MPKSCSQWPAEGGNWFEGRHFPRYAGVDAGATEPLTTVTLGFRVAGTVLCMVVATVLWGCGSGSHSALTPPQDRHFSDRQFPSVASSIAFVETDTREGNGVLIEGGYIVTNAQVVWPFQAADVVFADGTEFTDVPVRGMDFQNDLAVLGPIASPATGLKLVDGETTPKDSNVFVVGYPEKPEDLGQPSVESRRLLGIGRFGSAGITYLHTEAKLPADGASASRFNGWVLVSGRGDVIGVLGRRPSDSAYEVAVSSGDILPTVRQLIAGRNSSQLGERRIPLDGGETRHENTLEHFVEKRVYVINEPPGTEVNLELTGELDGYMIVLDSGGRWLPISSKDENEAASDSLVIESREPLFVVVHRHPVVMPQYPMAQGDFTLRSSHPLRYLHDPDDGRKIQVGDTVYGNIDYPGDWDYFLIELSTGETVEATNKSPVLDLVLTGYPLDGFGQIDFGPANERLHPPSDSSTLYHASTAGTYLVWAYRDSWGAPSGYVFEVKPAEPAFGLIKLKSAFAGLPDSLQVHDPADLGFSTHNISVRDHASDLVAYYGEEPFQMVVAASGELTESDRRSLDSDFSSGILLEEITQGFVGGADQVQQDFELLDNGVLDSSTVGTSSFGVYLEVNFEGVEGRIEVIMFRRENLFGMVYSYRHRGNPSIVSIDELGKMLDAKMIEVISARES